MTTSPCRSETPYETPMQWNEEANAGFSKAPVEALARAVVTDPNFAPDAVNVAQQTENADSLLERVRRLVRVRRACPEIGWGEAEVLDAGDPGVLALRASWRGGVVITLHNLSARHVTVALPIADRHDILRPLTCDSGGRLPQAADEPIAIPPHGYAWFRADEERR